MSYGQKSNATPTPNPTPTLTPNQVLVSYGQKSNAELLLLYGFVVDRNLFDEVELISSTPVVVHQ